MEIVYLQISSWKGMSIGAVHYYGLLVHTKDSERQTVELERELTAAEAKYRGRKDDQHWEKGDMTDGFRGKDQLIHLARQTWKEHFPDATILVQGRSAIAEPQTVLEGPKELKREMNALVAEVKSLEQEDDFERLSWEPDRWDAMDNICRKWNEIVEENK